MVQANVDTMAHVLTIRDGIASNTLSIYCVAGVVLKGFTNIRFVFIL